MKKAKKITAVFLSVFMMLSVFACVTVNADTHYVYDDFEFRYLSDNTARITDYFGTDTTLKIPDTLLDHPVSSIEQNAFYGDNQIAHIEFGANFTTITAMCFAKSTALKDVTLPATLETLVWGAFQECTALSSVKFLDSKVTSVPSTCFYGCTALRNVVLSNSILSISQKAFANCSVLEKVLIPSSVTEIDATAFSGVPNMTIYCYSGSFAHQFAKDNKINYILLDGADKIELENNIIAAEEILNAPEMYDPDAIALLGEAYESAVPVYLNDFATKNQITFANDELLGAIDSMVEYKYGDVDLDGTITIMDASAVQMYLAKFITLNDFQIKLADVTKDGNVSIQDASYIQMIVARLV